MDDTIPEEPETFYVNLSQEPGTSDSTGFEQVTTSASVTIMGNDGQGIHHLIYTHLYGHYYVCQHRLWR